MYNSIDYKTSKILDDEKEMDSIFYETKK